MSNYDNANRGAIWGNKKKEKDTHPDFTGSINVDGVDYWLNAWKRKPGDADNKPALSLSVKRKDGNSGGVGVSKNQHSTPDLSNEFDDNIPF